MSRENAILCSPGWDKQKEERKQSNRQTGRKRLLPCHRPVLGAGRRQWDGGGGSKQYKTWPQCFRDPAMHSKQGLSVIVGDKPRN